MKKPKLELEFKTVPELIQDAKTYVTKMTGNPNFPTPIPPLSDILNKTTALESAFDAAKSGFYAKRAEMWALTKELKHLLSFLANYVSSIAQGNEQIIFNAGMKTNKNPQPIGILPAPENLRLMNGINQSEIIVKFNVVKNAKSYVICYFMTGPAELLPQDDASKPKSPDIYLGHNLNEIKWTFGGVSTKSKYILTKLNVGERIIVRVAAVNKNGICAWSDPATLIVP